MPKIILGKIFPRSGASGTVAEILAPDVYDVELCDDDGRSNATLADKLMVLRNQGEPLRIVA